MIFIDFSNIFLNKSSERLEKLIKIQKKDFQIVVYENQESMNFIDFPIFS